MKNEKIKAILFWVFVITISILMTSCGARKAEKNRSTEEAQTVIISDNNVIKKDEYVSIVEEKTTVVDKEKVKETETTYKPIDATKEATVTTPEGKKHILNNAEVVIKETEKDKETKNDASVNSSITNKTELIDKSKSENKAANKKDSEAILIDRKEKNPLDLLWWLIPIAIVVFLFKNKSKIAGWISWPWWV